MYILQRTGYLPVFDLQNPLILQYYVIPVILIAFFFLFQGQPGIHLHDSVPGIHGGVFRGIADPAERKNLFILSHNQSMTFWWQHEKGLINKTK